MKPLKKHPKQQRFEDWKKETGHVEYTKSVNISSFLKEPKKHPKQQRMEEMTFPIIKPFKFYGAHDGTYGTSGGNLMGCEHGVDKRTICTQCENKVTMTGREYLRSINDDNGFTLLPRLTWRIVAVGVLVGAVIYFLSKAL